MKVVFVCVCVLFTTPQAMVNREKGRQWTSYCVQFEDNDVQCTDTQNLLYFGWYMVIRLLANLWLDIICSFPLRAKNNNMQTCIFSEGGEGYHPRPLMSSLCHSYFNCHSLCYKMSRILFPVFFFCKKMCCCNQEHPQCFKAIIIINSSYWQVWTMVPCLMCHSGKYILHIQSASSQRWFNMVNSCFRIDATRLLSKLF